MEIKKIILILTLLGAIFAYPLNYKIKYFGIHVADCSISNFNIKFNDYDAKKIIFKVKTKPFFRYLFPVDNNYELILNDNYETLFFSKNTFQPNVKNSIETEIREGKVFYKNSDLEIPIDSYNVFSLLYSIMNKEIPLGNFILEKEGMTYTSSVESLDSNIYDFIINDSEYNSNKSIVQNTDIFTWGIFLKKSKRRLIIDSESGLINKCIFKKGIITIRAELDN